jgi:cellulose synthase/poly-beta-1,6-N-acetylglucosamine synthase-like glycosyltransferase
MYDLSFLSLPLVLILNLYVCLWFFLAIIYLTRKSSFTHPTSQKHFVSVIVPARNEEAVICNLILDLKSQTYKNMEVIVVCHNCTDKTFEKVSQVAENSSLPTKVYKLKTQKPGKALALQYGLSHSHGEFIAYFDADNHIEKNVIEKMVECIESGFDGVQAKITSKNPNTNNLTLLQHIEFLIYGPIFCGGKHKIGLNAGIGGTGVMVRRIALEKIGGFRNVLIEDFDLHLRLTIKGFKIGYAEHVNVYDEKVTQWRFLIKQRAR